MATKPKARNIPISVKTYLLTPAERLELHLQATDRHVSESWLVAEFIRKGLEAASR